MNRRLLFFSCLLAALPSEAFCQSITGALLGTVSDPTGAIPGATVEVTSQDTGLKLTTKSDGTGSYDVTNLTPGLYRIKVTATGYKTIEIKDIHLLINEHLRNNVTLPPGGFGEVVEVRPNEGETQSDSPSIATVTTGEVIEEIPTNGRTISTVLATAAGNTGEASDSNPKIAGSQHWGGTSFMVNGVSYNDLGNGGGSYAYTTSLTTQPSLDAIQDVKIEANSAKAEYASSVAVTMTTKGGTNKFHGTLFEFNRNNVVGANSYFAKIAGTKRLPYNRNEFGGTIGGPVWRDHTFFFFSYERYSLRTNVQGYFIVPTDAQRSGVFTTAITDPTTGLAFANNTIPTSRLDSRTLAILQYVPHANTSYNGYNLTEAKQSRLDLNRYSGKLEQVFNAKNRLALDLNYSASGTYSVNLGYPNEYGNYSDAGYKTKSAALTYTRVLTPSMTNELRASYYVMTSTRLGENTGFDGTTLFPGLYPHQVGGLPIFSITGYTRIGDSGGSRSNPQITEQFGDTYTWQHGNHTVKAGADLQISRVSTNPTSSTTTLGYFNFVATRYAKNAFANALLGLPSSALRSNVTPPDVIHQNRYGFYLQDDWKIVPRFTLYAGLRYELQTTPTERNGQWTNFDYDDGSLIVRSVNRQIPSTANADLLALYPPKLSEDVGWGSDVMVSDKKNFAPRLGFSYRPYNDGSFVLRGGFGIFYNMPAIYQGIYQLGISNPPFRITQEYDSGTTTPTVTLANPFAVTPTITANPVLYSVDHQLHNTYSQQWNASVENKLIGGVGLRISYVGNKAVHAPFVNYNMNQSAVQQNAADQTIRPYQPYGAIYGMRFSGSSTTQQMQVEATRRFHNSLFFQTNFNWTKGLDNVPETGSPQNPYNPAGDRGNADGVRRFVFNFTGGLELPFGRGKFFLNRAGVVDHLVGGWRVTTVTQMLSGSPFSVTYTPQISGWYATRANVVAGVPLYPAGRTLAQYFNAAAFTAPTTYTYGTSTRNMLFGPGEQLVNMNIVKTTSLFEGIKLELRADAFNLTNRANFANPAASLNTPTTVGVVSATSTDPRALQFGAKLLF